MISKDSFCVGPWAEARINSDGTVSYCHAAARSNVGTITDGLPLVWHGSAIANVRAQIQSSWLSPCAVCKVAEGANVVSFRQRRNSQYGIFHGRDFEQSFAESRFQVNKVLEPRFYHISVSNLCNLGCVMCQPRDSSFLAAEENSLLQTVHPVNNWSADQETWERFLQDFLLNNQVVCVHFMGGEPLYQKRFFEFVEFCVKERHTNFHLTFATNATAKLPQKYIDLFQKFLSVQIETSIETLDRSNDYIRYPSNTSLVIENIIALHNLRHSANIETVLRTVPQFLSGPEYHKVLWWCLDNELKVDSNYCTRPDYFNLKYLPDELKDTIVSRLEELRKAIPATAAVNVRLDAATSIATNIDFVIAQLMQQPLDGSEKYIALRNKLNFYDKARNLAADDFFPWLRHYGI